MAAVTPRRAKLGARLRAMRATAYPSGLQFAEAVGWPQSRVSKLERGAQLPKEEDLRLWLRKTGQPAHLLDELMGEARDAALDYTPDRAVGAGGFVARQAERGATEARTGRIVEYQPGIVPGLVQTSAYARELLANTVGGLAEVEGGPEQIDDLVNERVRRQDLLYEPNRRIEILLDEGALYHRPGHPDTMVGQLDRLLSFAELPSVYLGVVPFTAPMTVLPLSNFTVHDDSAVLIESLTGEQEHAEPDEIATYLSAVERLWRAARHGHGARELIQRAIDWHHAVGVNDELRDR